jgi:DNA-binding CsgD family transcriptional regulator
MADRAVLGSWVDISGVANPAQHALTIAREVDEPALLVRVLMACAFINMHNAEKAQPYFVEPADLARALGDSWRLSQILSRQSTGGMLVGDAAAAALHGEEGLALADTIGDHFNARQCRLGIAWAHMCRGETATAVAQYADLIAEARTAHDVMSLVSAVVPGAFAYALHGDVDGARATSAAAIEACTELGFLLAEAYSGIVMAELVAGDGAAALAAAETAMGSNTNIAIQRHNWWSAAQAALACGDTVRARQWADGAAESTSGMFLALALAARAHVHIAEGDFEQAAVDACDGLAIAGPMAGYLCVPDLLECLAEVSSYAGNLQHAARLVGSADAMRHRLELPRFKVYDAGHDAVVAALRTTLGNSEFDDACTEGAALSTEEAIAYAQRGRGERKRPSSGWESLTPTELDVVRLVAEGIPNKDIAVRLFVSPRTVQSHLRHVYNKLALTSRVQLAQEAARRS